MPTDVDVSAEDQNQLTTHLSREEQKPTTVKSQKALTATKQRLFPCILVLESKTKGDFSGDQDEPSECFKE